MKKWGLIVGAVAAALVPATPLAARDEPEVLAPASAWVVDYADDSCALRRQFGEVGHAVVLELRQFAPGSVNYQYKLLSDIYRLNNRYAATGVRIRYLPDAEPTDAVAAFNLEPQEQWRGITFAHSLFERPIADYDEENPAAEPAERSALVASLNLESREQAITGIEIRNAFNQDIILQTGSLRAPMNAMRECLDELLTHWGIDAQAHRTLRQAALPIDQHIWARQVQEVDPGARRGEQAVLRIRLAISVEGRVTGCHMQQRMGQEQFAQAACDALRQYGRFSPALDAQGNPIASFYPLTMFYRSS